MTNFNRRMFLASAAAASWASGVTAAQDMVLVSDLNGEEAGITNLARSLSFKRITTRGFMVPPAPGDRYFLLSSQPMPPHDPDGHSHGGTGTHYLNYPEEVITVLAEEPFKPTEFWRLIEVKGVLMVAPHTDPDTGFFSALYLKDATWQVFG